MKIVETERLLLRWLTPDDAPFMLGLLNEPSFIANIGDRGVRTLDGAREYIANGAIASYEQNGYGLYMVELKRNGTPAGICGLVKRPVLADADVGFAFLPAYWSQGYAHESAAAVMRFAREQAGLARVVAIVSPGNEPSIRLLRKLGLEYDRMIALPDSGEQCALFAPCEIQEQGC
jgi:RimJ/RimL family protein N-acetyltransferase